MFRFVTHFNKNVRGLSDIVSKFQNFFVAKNNIVDINNPNIVFVFGGDGYLLDAIKQYSATDASYMLINAGNLGFYSEISIDDLEEFYRNFDYEKLIYETHHFVKITDEFGHTAFGANEIMVASGVTTLTANLSINDEDFMRIIGNGICISTAFGSSGYNHSLGGPLMVDENGLAMSLLAPIHNARSHPEIRSLLLRNKDKITLEVTSTYPYEVAADMKIIKEFEGNKFTIKKCEKSFRLAHIKSVNQYQRIKRAFIN